VRSVFYIFVEQSFQNNKSMAQLDGKVAVVTGGTSGIGYASAEALIKQGARVLFTGRNKDSVAAAARKLGATGLVSDQSDLSQIDLLVKATSDTMQKVDILLVNAGTFKLVPFHLVSEEFYDGMMAINQKGVFFTIQKMLPLLNDNASIILMSAMGTKGAGARGASVFYLTKAAMNSMVRSLSIELAPRGIRINSILPAAIDTPIFEGMGVTGDALNQVKATLSDIIPLKRMGTPADIANLVAFLAADESSFITGTEYIIDGGLSRRPPL
jgi:NAD(P)-dependent dehydrogenase (short-subunit alcohol dehydrogenase family)